MSSSTMRAIGVSEYGPSELLYSKQIERPSKPIGRQLLVNVKGTSVNPVDTKVRSGTYDDAPDYYDRAKPLIEVSGIHVMGYEGAGVVIEVGPDVKNFKSGDEVLFIASPLIQGTNAEVQLLNETQAAHKPKTLDFVQSAVMPLTYGTAYDALINRLNIEASEKSGILIINGGGGMGSIASQIARYILRLPVVITTVSREETMAFSSMMGATHVVNHREDIVKQICDLDLPEDVPLKYAFITARTEQYIKPIGDLLVPFGKVCSIVQAKFDLYGTQFMSKSLTFAWCWVGSGGYHNFQNDRPEKFYEWYEEMARLIDKGTIKCHLTKRLKLNVSGLRQAHRIIERGQAVGKIGLGVDELGDQAAFY
jgi:NADPH:quinone reductase-like Zn-dependent oxidoreductase